MASTSVHLPADLVAALDRLASERGVSRNSLIVESCRRMVAGLHTWPKGYLAGDYLLPEDLRELREGFDEFLGEIVSHRRSRQVAPL